MAANREGYASDHFDGKKFFNPWNPGGPKGFFDFLKWQFGGGRVNWPDRIVSTAVPQLPGQVRPGEAHVTLVNHATLLVQLEGLNVLTDPVYSERVSPVQWAGPKRVCEPGITMDSLPRVHVVVVSHSHYDHMDLSTLKLLSDKFKPMFIVPLGNKKILEAAGATNVVELDWWAKADLSDGRSVMVVPTQHWSARGVFDRNEALWGGFVLQSGGVKVFFAGDTGYGPHFSMIAERAGDIDVGLLPIGAYEPRWFMKDQHMNPSDALKAHADLRSVLSIGMHFGCFQLTNEGIDEPVRALKEAMKSEGVPDGAFIAPQNGQTILYRKAGT